MKNNAVYKYQVALGIVIVVSVIAIGAVVHRNSRVAKRISAFAKEVDAAQNLDAAVYSFLNDPIVQPLIYFSTSDASEMDGRHIGPPPPGAKHPGPPPGIKPADEADAKHIGPPTDK